MNLCFGDDSINDGLIAYIIIGIQEEKINEFIGYYGNLKQKFNLEKNYVLHCKDLFHISKRTNNKQISHLNYYDVKKLCNYIVNLCVHFKMPRPILGYANRNDFPKLIKKQEFNTAKFDEKQGLHFLKNSCLLTLYDQHGKDESKYCFYSDKIDKNDKASKYALALGGIRRRVNMPNILISSDISEKQDFIRLTEKKYEDCNYKEMYEIADLFVYISIKALCFQQYYDKEYFINLLYAINPIKNAFIKEN